LSFNRLCAVAAHSTFNWITEWCGDDDFIDWTSTVPYRW
jgi:hypothetical protein